MELHFKSFYAKQSVIFHFLVNAFRAYYWQCLPLEPFDP